MGGGRATVTGEYQRDWPAYFDAVAGKPPRDTLVRALDAFEPSDAGSARPVWRSAVDIAAGEGRDTREMLRRGGPTRWKVMAVDASGEGLERLSRSLAERDRGRVLLTAARMEDIPRLYAVGPRPAGRLARGVDLMNASFALPFCDERDFPDLWAWIAGHLKSGGRFAGQFFGDRDEWAQINPARHRTRAQVLGLLQGFEVEHLEEVEKDGDDAMGGVKHHHVFHVVARKR